MPVVSLLLRREARVCGPDGSSRTFQPEREDVELDDLTPRARALAEALAQHGGELSDVVMEQDATIREAVKDWEAFYPGRGDEHPRRVGACWGLPRPALTAGTACPPRGAELAGPGLLDAHTTAVEWLEREVRTWELDWYVISAVGHDRVPSWQAGAADRYLTPQTALDYLRNAGHPLGRNGGLFQRLAAAGYLPADRVVCGVRQWRPETIDAFLARPVTLWTVSHAAEYLGYTGSSAGSSARKQFHRWQLKPVAREPGGGGESLYDADQIKALHAARPGSGRRGAARTGGKFTRE
ncbi:hypothetical protein [Streptomyces bacillaris]|uniref:hypothetical protein n=1 Tax=Streptomyces bacillaris TaxID=68179 RepID=UPI00345F7AD8